jgi:hypothetical protein
MAAAPACFRKLRREIFTEEDRSGLFTGGIFIQAKLCDQYTQAPRHLKAGCAAKS